MTSASAKTPILIVGAGPSGLVLALWLRRKGVAFRIIDQSAGPGETSRALAVQARTLEFYRQLGIAEDLIARGVIAKSIALRRLGRPVAQARFGALGTGMSPYTYLLFCSQDVHETMLVERLAREGVTIERKTRLDGFTAKESGVTARITGPRGEETIESQYIVGCDGAHSAVRRGMGLDFPGGTYSQVFYVADVSADGQVPPEGVEVSVSAEDFCIIMPIERTNTIRLTGVVPPSAEKKEKIEFADVAASVRRNAGVAVTKVNWFSPYHVHHRVAPRFKLGRAFLVGDAAHIHSPAGGQGMNTGIGDAVNLAWKLAEVLSGRAPPPLLETYEPERIAFARRLVATTDAIFRIVASRSAPAAFFRSRLLPRGFAFLTRFPAFLRFAFRTISQIRIRYGSSALSRGSAGKGKVRAGDRLPWVGDVDNFRPLGALAWQVHVYGGGRPDFRAKLASLGVPLHEFPWNFGAEAQGLVKDAAYFVRPDGHVGYVTETQDLVGSHTYVSAWIKSGPQSGIFHAPG